MKWLWYIFLFNFWIMSFAVAEPTAESNHEKLSQDPTKVVSQIGLTYSDELKLSGSLSFDAAKKINVRINDDLSEWRIGGSWLFDIGIVNFNIGRKEFDYGAYQTNYSIGTFVPLSYFGFKPLDIQFFPAAGISYNDGDIAVSRCSAAGYNGTCGIYPDADNGFILLPSSSFGGYLGIFGLKPVTDKWTVFAGAVGSLGSSDYHGTSFSAGAGYKFTKNQAINGFFYTVDNSFGDDQKFGLSYRYQFN